MIHAPNQHNIKQLARADAPKPGALWRVLTCAFPVSVELIKRCSRRATDSRFLFRSPLAGCRKSVISHNASKMHLMAFKVPGLAVDQQPPRSGPEYGRCEAINFH